MLNKIEIQGRLCADVVFKETDSYKMARFKIANDRDYVRRGEDRKANFVNCTAFGSTADFLQKYSEKGDMLVIVGELQIDDDKENKRSYTSIVVENAYLVGQKRKDSGNQSAKKDESEYDEHQARFEELNNSDGELPF